MVPWEEVDAVLAAGISEPKSSLTLTFELHIEIVRSYGFRFQTFIRFFILSNGYAILRELD